jgi:multiple sugar transport system substrate-binding protein
MKYTRPGVILAFLIGLTLAAGCMDDSIIDSPGEVRRTDEVAQKKVVVWHTYSDEETNAFEKVIIPQFEAANPGIRIESVRQAHNPEFMSSLMSRISAGKTPDVIRLDYAWLPLFAQRGLLEPLDEYPEFEKIYPKLSGRMLASNTFKNQVYGLPLNITTKAAIFNRKLLEASGVTHPPDSLTELFDLAAKHDYVIGIQGYELWHSLPYFLGLGGQLANDAFSQSQGYLNSDASVAAMSKLLGAFRAGVLNPRMISRDADVWTDVHSSNHMLMIDEGPWFYSILLADSRLGTILQQLTWPTPFPTDGEYGAVTGGESLVMAKSTRHKAEAWTFIQWMMKKETQQILYRVGLIPTNMEAISSSHVSEQESGWYLEPYIEGLNEAFYFPPIPEWIEIESSYNAMMENIFVRGIDVKQAMDKAASDMDEILALRKSG